MAARYQHVTDAMRSQVASQLGELIWDSAVASANQALVTVRYDSLAEPYLPNHASEPPARRCRAASRASPGCLRR